MLVCRSASPRRGRPGACVAARRTPQSVLTCADRNRSRPAVRGRRPRHGRSRRKLHARRAARRVPPRVPLGCQEGPGAGEGDINMPLPAARAASRLDVNAGTVSSRRFADRDAATVKHGDPIPITRAARPVRKSSWRLRRRGLRAWQQLARTAFKRAVGSGRQEGDVNAATAAVSPALQHVARAAGLAQQLHEPGAAPATERLDSSEWSRRTRSAACGASQ